MEGGSLLSFEVSRSCSPPCTFGASSTGSGPKPPLQQDGIETNRAGGAVGKGGGIAKNGLGRRGIAAANIEIEKTGVSATTIHNMFEESFFYGSRPIRLSPVTLSAPLPQQLSSGRRRVCASAGP